MQAPVGPPPFQGQFDAAQKFKTKLCEHFLASNSCVYGPYCAFAHGVSELRPYPKRSSVEKSFPVPSLPPPAYSAHVPPLQPSYMNHKPPPALHSPPPNLLANDERGERVGYVNSPSSPATRSNADSQVSSPVKAPFGSPLAEPPPAYPTHFRHEPYIRTGRVFSSPVGSCSQLDELSENNNGKPPAA